MSPDPAPPPPAVGAYDFRTMPILGPSLSLPGIANTISMSGGDGVVVTINQQTGEVRISGGTVDDGARLFWERVQQMFPGCKP